VSRFVIILRFLKKSLKIKKKKKRKKLRKKSWELIRKTKSTNHVDSNTWLTNKILLDMSHSSVNCSNKVIYFIPKLLNP
jgi:hypothetical protein